MLNAKARRDRRKAKNVRAIKAYWKARAFEANVWLRDALADLDWAYAAPVENNNYFGHEWGIKQAQKAVDTYEGLLRNAVSRYCMAIPKGGIGKY